MAANDPAFPTETKRNTSSDPFATPRTTFQHPGLTKREYAAIHIACALLTDAKMVAELTKHRNGNTRKAIADGAYNIADALLSASVEGA